MINDQFLNSLPNYPIAEIKKHLRNVQDNDLIYRQLLSFAKLKINQLLAKRPDLQHVEDELVSVLNLCTWKFILRIPRLKRKSRLLGYYWRSVLKAISDLSYLHLTGGASLHICRKFHPRRHFLTDYLTSEQPINILESIPIWGQEFIRLKLEGYTEQEIAEELELTKWEIQKFKQRLRQHIQKEAV